MKQEINLTIGVITSHAAIIKDLLADFSDLFSDKETTSTLKHDTLHYIKTKGPPQNQRYRPLTPEKLQIAEETFDRLLRQGTVQRSSSPWAAPLHMERKPNNTWRPCGDYRQLNIVTQADSYPIPNILHMLDRLRNKAIFTVLDLREAFHQVPVAPEDVPKTAVITPFGLFEFLKMPFGLRCASQTFQRLLDSILFHCREFAMGYIDDVIIYSDTPEEHVKHLRRVLELLRQNGLRINHEKSQIALPQVNYLSHTICKNQVAPLSAKVDAITKLKSPTTVNELQRVFGMINYYRRFVPHLANRAATLHRHLKGTRKGSKKQKIDWSDEDERLLREIVLDLAECASLTIPDLSAPFTLTTDASDFAIGAVLEQTIDGANTPVAFYSRILQAPERNYDTFGRELLAIHDAVQHFSRLLSHNRFTVRTDHKPLIPLFEKSNITSKHPRRVHQQLSRLSDFHFTLAHVAGSENDVADMLSRPQTDTTQLNLVESQGEAATTTASLRCLHEAQQSDEKLQELAQQKPWQYKCIELQSLPIFHKKHRQTFLPYVPEAMQRQIFDQLHSLSHPGAKATAKLICSRYAGENLHANALKWTQQCLQCQANKVTRHTKSPLLRTPMPRQRFRVIHADVVYLGECEGYQYALTIIDRFTRWLEVVPLRTLTAEETVYAMRKNWIAWFGVPETIVTDNGTNFTASVFHNTMEALGATVQHTLAFNPRENGMIERPHRELKAALRANNGFESWVQALPTVLLAMRARHRESINTSAAFLCHGEEMRLPNEPPTATTEDTPISEVVQSLKDHTNALRPRQPRTRDVQVHIPRDLETCRRVWLRNDARMSSREPPYLGPYEVLERRARSFTIYRRGKTTAVSIDRLRPVNEGAATPNDAPSPEAPRAVRFDVPIDHVRDVDGPSTHTRTRTIRPPDRYIYET